MARELTQWLGASLALVALGMIVDSGCRIQLCKGEGCGGVPDVGGWGGSSGESGSTSLGGGGSGSTGYTPTPDEQAAIDTAQEMDPQVRALNTARAGYVGYAVRGLVEEQIVNAALDPATIDVNTLTQMFDDAAAAAWDETNQWAATLDPATLASPGYPVNVECLNPPVECRVKVSCPFAQTCVVDDCGDGKCQPCPDKYGLGNLVTSGWCSYVCYVGPDAAGVAVSFKPRIGADLIPWITLCFKN